jgi:sulfotransferase
MRALFISDDQRACILKSLVAAYYAGHSDRAVIFDTGRIWCVLLPAISQLFPGSKVICCVRNPAWILDSLERLVQRNSLVASKLFDNEVGSVYHRVETLTRNGIVGGSLNALRQAWFGEYASSLIAIRYESLTERPAEVADTLYDELGEPRFVHDFDRLDYCEPEFDDRLGLRGLHDVAKQVKAVKRETVLPPELFSHYNRNFWELAGQNPRGVRVL